MARATLSGLAGIVDSILGLIIPALKTTRQVSECSFIDMEQSHILYLSPEDSINLFPTNTSTSFVVEFDKTIKLPPECFVELIEFRGMMSDRSRDSIYVMTDICENSTVFGTQAPVLRAITLAGVRRVAQEFITPYKIKVSTEELQRCHIYLRGRDFKALSFEVSEVEVTLRLSWLHP